MQSTTIPVRGDFLAPREALQVSPFLGSASHHIAITHHHAWISNSSSIPITSCWDLYPINPKPRGRISKVKERKTKESSSSKRQFYLWAAVTRADDAPPLPASARSPPASSSLIAVLLEDKRRRERERGKEGIGSPARLRSLLQPAIYGGGRGIGGKQLGALGGRTGRQQTVEGGGCGSDGGRWRAQLREPPVKARRECARTLASCWQRMQCNQGVTGYQ
jgi:hypothetical protein